MLAKNARSEVQKRLESEYQRLVHPDGMGEIYKVFYVGKDENGWIDLKYYKNNYFRWRLSFHYRWKPSGVLLRK